ncbi:MAG: metal-dependent transcriptional regulator [Promethearchaeota archaeon]|nr:MAG: metal-dependent transcriptional regulator [Candidatus Lokiarchaeota archaeon]
MKMGKTEIEENLLNDVPESYQRYLDEIYNISRKKRGGWVSNKELAKSLKVKPASVSGMLEKLSEKNLIIWEPRKAIRLTGEGRKIAEQLNEIHMLLNEFFEKVLKIADEQVVEDLSCEIEHHITDEVKESLREFLSKYLK